MPLNGEFTEPTINTVNARRIMVSLLALGNTSGNKWSHLTVKAVPCVTAKTNDARRIAANIAKLPMVPSHVLKEIPRQRYSVSRDD